MIAGPIGSERQFEYTVIGDTVNLAARLQNLTRNLDGHDIIITADVYDLLDDAIRNKIRVVSPDDYEIIAPRLYRAQGHLSHLVDFGEMLVKGKKGPVRVYGVPN